MAGMEVRHSPLYFFISAVQNAHLNQVGVPCPNGTDAEVLHDAARMTAELSTATAI